MAERRWQGGTHQVAPNSYQLQRQQRASFSALPVVMSNTEDTTNYPRQPGNNNISSNPNSTDPPSFADHGRFSDPLQRLSAAAAHNLSITDADKWEQQGHENVTVGYHGDGYQGHENVTGGYRGDGCQGERIPSRYLFGETVNPNFQNVGHNPGRYPAERSSNFQPYFHGDTSSSSAATASSYSRRLPWADNSRAQLQSQVLHSHHHHHVRLFKTMTKCIVTLDKKVNESIGPFKKHTGNKIAVIIITRFSSKCQIVSTSSKVID